MRYRRDTGSVLEIRKRTFFWVVCGVEMFEGGPVLVGLGGKVGGELGWLCWGLVGEDRERVRGEGGGELVSALSRGVGGGSSDQLNW